MSHIDALGNLSKAGHKYHARRMVGGKWQYDYGQGWETKKKGSHKMNLKDLVPEDEKKVHTAMRSMGKVIEATHGASISKYSGEHSKLIRTRDKHETVLQEAARGLENQTTADALRHAVSQHRHELDRAVDQAESNTQRARDSASSVLREQSNRAARKRDIYRSMDHMSHIDALQDLAKAGPHKYKSRKRNAKGGYDYDYGNGYGKGKAKPKPKAVAKERHWIEKGAEVGIGDTKKAHTSGGAYTAERAKLHEELVGSFTDHVPVVPPDKKPVAIVMMGGTASGKGTILRHIQSDQNDFVNVNPDDVKERLPEYEKMVRGMKDSSGKPTSVREAAWLTHEESSDVADQVRQKAVAERKNLVLDGTGKNAEKYKKKIEALKKAGYHIRLLMPHIDMEEALKRAHSRADHTGRFVPDEVVEHSHHMIPGNFRKVAESAHEYVLFDNRGPPPKPVLVGTPDGGEMVFDQKFMESFDANASAKHKAARERGWMGKSWAEYNMSKSEADDKPPSVPLDDFLKRFSVNRGEAEDSDTGMEDYGSEVRDGLDRKAGIKKSHIDALGDLAKAFGKDDNRDDGKNDKTNSPPPGAAKSPQPGKPGKPGKPGEEGPELTKPGNPEGDTKRYATKVEGEDGEFQFIYQEEAERDPDARFVVSPETADGAHWELPHHGEHYDKFKQWKSAKKQGLHGTDIPKELVDGAMAHAEKHHFDAGPHKAAYDDHLAHQGGDQAPTPPPSHASQAQNGNGPPKGMQPKAGAPKPGEEKSGSKGPPQQDDAKEDKGAKGKPMVGKASRSGMEANTKGRTMQEAEDTYMKLYGECKKADGAGDLSKGLYQFNLSGGAKVPIPDRLLYEYLCAFICEALEHEKREPEHRMLTAGEDVYATFSRAVMGELVAMIPNNKNLARAVGRYKVTTDGIAKILKEKNLLAPASDGATDHGDYWASDWDSSQAMGGEPRKGPLNDSLMASQGPDWAQTQARPDATRPLRVQGRGRMVHFGPEVMNPTGTVEHMGKAQLQHNRYEGSDIQVVKGDCPTHGTRDLTADQNLSRPYAKCTCRG